MKGQLSLSVWGLSGEGVELFSRSEAFAFSLNSQLFFLDSIGNCIFPIAEVPITQR